MVNDIYNKLKTVQSVVKEFGCRDIGKQVLKEENVAKGFLGPNKEEHLNFFYSCRWQNIGNIVKRKYMRLPERVEIVTKQRKKKQYGSQWKICLVLFLEP